MKLDLLDVRDQLALLERVRDGSHTIHSGSDFTMVEPLVRLLYVSVYTDKRGVVRTRLKQDGEAAIESARALLAKFGEKPV